MIFLVIGGCAVFFTVVFLALATWADGSYKTDLSQFFTFLMVVSVVVFGISVAGLVIGTSVSYSNQLSRFEAVKENLAVTKILQARADNLTAQFTEYLAKQYPQYEKDIFGAIAPQNVEVYLAKYPEIKSSETLLALVGQIRQLNDSVYDQQIRLEGTLRSIRFAPQNPWTWHSWIPQASPEVLGLSQSK